MDLHQALARERLTREICSALNQFTDLHATLEYVISRVKELLECEAVGIRIKQDQDFPYYVTNGFKHEFIADEKSLLMYGDMNTYDGISTQSLACLCGRVITENTRGLEKFMTSNGSLVVNSVTKLNQICEQLALRNLRGNCFREGYQSLVLIPIRAKGQVVSLLHIVDRKRNKFKKYMVDFLELIGENIGLAVQNSMAYTRLLNYQKLEEDYKTQALALQKVEEVDKLRTEFFANLSHEMRTPISVILASMNLVKTYQNKEPQEIYKPRMEHHMESIEMNCHRMLKLVNNLIDVSRFSSDAVEFIPRRINIVRLVEEVVEEVSTHAHKRGIELIFDTNTEERYIGGDVDKLGRIILNLLSNALKFTDTGGFIAVTLRDVGDGVEIMVKDNGCGIEEERLSSIFDYFLKGGRQFNRTKEGCGLGLAFVKATVDMHGGSITVESIPGYGSEFIVTLPNHDEAPPMEREDMVARFGYGVRERVQTELSDIACCG